MHDWKGLAQRKTWKKNSHFLIKIYEKKQGDKLKGFITFMNKPNIFQ